MTTTTVNAPRTKLRQALAIVGATIVLAASLPLLIVVGWAARALLIVAIPLGLVTVFASPAVRRWLGGEFAETAVYRGLKFPSHLRLHPAHVWARLNPDRTVTVGADDLMQQAVGTVDQIGLPAIGTRVERGDTLFELRHGERKLQALAPVAGTVARTNPALTEDPQLLNLSPYLCGWTVELEPKRMLAPLRGLRRGFGAVRAFCHDVDRLLEVAAGRAYAQDGGEVADDLHMALDDEAWEQVRRDIFAQN